MTRLLLVRHADHDWLGRGIAGRLPGVSLNAKGREQADALAEWLADAPMAAICSSPQPRALETIAPLAQRRRMPVETSEGFDEIDFGQWMGQHFDALEKHPLWDTWVGRRSIATPPGGEPFTRVLQRASEGIDRLVRLHPDATVLVVSHGDVIKALLASVLGMSLDHLERLEIAPASVSVVAAGPGWSQVRMVNAGPAVRLP